MIPRHQDDRPVFQLIPEDQTPEIRREVMGILLKSIRDIELQLGCKERTDAEGKRLPAKEYMRWRRNAIKAMNNRTELYRRYKALEKDAQNAVEAPLTPLSKTAAITTAILNGGAPIID